MSLARTKRRGKLGAVRLWSTIIGGLLLVAPCLLGQVTVEVSFDEEQYLARESLVAAVKIVNFSGQTLKLGAEQDWLRFSVESDNYYVAKRGDPPVVEPFDLPSAAKATRRVDLAPYFDMGRPGHCRVTATVRIAQLGQEITSAPAKVNIISGTKLWELEFGLPVPAGNSEAAPETRKYALLQTMSQKRMRLYVQVSDRNDATVYRIFPLGRLLSFSRPETQVDREAQLHVLFQTGAREFTYCVVNPDGELLKRQTHSYTDAQTDARPKLRADKEGKIGVAGGTRVVSSTDWPKPSDTEVPPPAPTSPPPSADKPGAGKEK